MEYEKGEPPDHPTCHKGTEKLLLKDNNESKKKTTSSHDRRHQIPVNTSPCRGDEQCQRGNCHAERQPDARRRGHKRRSSRYISGRGHGKRKENEKCGQNTNETQDLNFPRDSTTRRQLPRYKLTAGMKSSAQILTENEKLASVGLTEDLKEKCLDLFAKYPNVVIKKHNGRLEIEKAWQPSDLRNDASATSAVFPDCISDVQYQSRFDNTREGSEPTGSIDIAHFKPYIKGRKNGKNIAVGGSREPFLPYRQKFENLKLIVEELSHIRSDLLKKASSGHKEIGGQAEAKKRFFEFKERDLPLYTPNITNLRIRNYDEELTKNTNIARKRLIENVKSFILGGEMSPCEPTKNDSQEETSEDSNLFLSENSQKLFEKGHPGKCVTIAPNLQKLPFFEQPTKVLSSPGTGKGNQNNFSSKGLHTPKEPVKSSPENLERLTELKADHEKHTETDDQVRVSDGKRKSQWTCTKWPEKNNNEAPAPYRCPKWTYETYSDTGLTGMATTDSCGSHNGSKKNYLQQSEILNLHNKANENRQDENYNISAKAGVSMKQEKNQPHGDGGANAVTSDGGYRHDDPKKSFENHPKMGPKQNECKNCPYFSPHKDQELFSDGSQRKDKYTSLDTADSGSLQLNCNAAVTHLLGSDRFGKQRPFGFEETFVKRTSNVEQTLAKTTSIITDTLRSAFETIMGSASKEEEEYGKPYDVYINGRQEYEETFLDNKEYEIEIYNPNKKQSPKEFVVGYDRDGKVTNPSYGTHKKIRRREHMNLKAVKGTPPSHCLQGTEKSKSESSESPISYQFLCDWEPKDQKSPKRKRKEKKRRRGKCSASDSSILEHKDVMPCRKADKSTRVKHKHKHIVPISTDETRDINTLFLSTTPGAREPKIMLLSPEDRKRSSKKTLRKHSSSKPVRDNSSSTLFDGNELKQKEKQDLKSHSRKKRTKKNKDIHVDLPLPLSDMSSPQKQSERKEKVAKKTKRHRPSPSNNYMRKSEDELAFESVSSTELSQSILKLYEEIHKLTLQIEASASDSSIYTSPLLPDTDENTLDRSAPVDRERLITPYFDEPSTRASTCNLSRNNPEKKKGDATESNLSNTTKTFDDEEEELEDTLDEIQEAKQENTKNGDEEDKEDDDGYFKVSPKTCTICPRNEIDKDENEVKENKMVTDAFLCSENSSASKKYENFGFESFNIKSPSTKCFACYHEDQEPTGSQKETVGSGVNLMEQTESEGDRYFPEVPPTLLTADTSPPAYHVGLSHNPIVSTFPPEYHPSIISEPQMTNKEGSPVPEYYRDDTMANLSYVKFVSPPKFFSTPVQLKRSYENRSGSPSYDDKPCFACEDSDDWDAAREQRQEQEQEQWQEGPEEEQWQEQPEVTTLDQALFQDPSIIFTSGLAPQSPPQPVTCENTLSQESKKFKGIMTQECSGVKDHPRESMAALKAQLNVLSNFKTHTRNAPLPQMQSMEKFDMTREKNSSSTQKQSGKNNYNILKMVERSHSKQDSVNKSDLLSKENRATFLKKNFNDHNQATKEKNTALKHKYSVRSSKQKSSKSEEKLLQRSSPTSGERTTNPKQQREKEIDLTSKHKNVTLSKKYSLKGSSDLQEHPMAFTDRCINNESSHLSKGDTARVTQHYKIEKDKISQKVSPQVRQNHSNTNNPISNKSKSSVTQQYSHGYKSYARENDEKKLKQESSKENNQITNNPVSTKSKSSITQQYSHGYKSYARGNGEKKLKPESSKEDNLIPSNPVSTKNKSSVTQQYAHGYKSYARGNDAEKLKQENSKENNQALQEKKSKSTQPTSNLYNLTSHSTQQKDAMPKFTIRGENNEQLLGRNSKDNKFSEVEKSKSNQGCSKENGQGFRGPNSSGVRQQSGKEINKISTAENCKETSVFDNSVRVLPTRYMFKSTGPLGDSKIVCTSEAAVPISNNTAMKSNASSSYKSTPSEHDKNSNGYRGRSQIESPSLHYSASKGKEFARITSLPTARQGNINSMSQSETVLGLVERENKSYTSLPTGFAPKPLNAYYEHSENLKSGTGFPRVQNVSCVWDIEHLLTDAEPFEDRPSSNEAELKHRSETTLQSPSPTPTGSTMNCLRDILFGSARALELTSDTKQHACPPKSRSAHSKKDGDGNVKCQGNTSLQQSSDSSDLDEYCIDAYINCRTQKPHTSPRRKHPAGNSNGKSEYQYKHPILNSSERQSDLKLNLNLTSGRDKGAGEMNCENQNYDVELWEREEAKTLGIKGRNLWPKPENTSYDYPYKSWDDDAEIASKLVAHYSDAIKSSRRKNRPDCSPRPPFTHCTSPHKIQGERSIKMDEQASAENVPFGLTHQVYKQTNLDKVGLDAVREPANFENVDRDLRKPQSFEFEPTYQSVGNEKLMSSFEHLMNLKRPCYVQHCGFRRRQQENLNAKPSSNDNNSSTEASPRSDCERPGGKQHVSECRYQPVEEYGSFYKIEEESPFERIVADNYSFCQEDLSDDEERYGENRAEESNEEEEENGNQKKKEFEDAYRDKSEGRNSVSRNEEMALDEESVDEDEATDEDSGDDVDDDDGDVRGNINEKDETNFDETNWQRRADQSWYDYDEVGALSRRSQIYDVALDVSEDDAGTDEEDEAEEEEEEGYEYIGANCAEVNKSNNCASNAAESGEVKTVVSSNQDISQMPESGFREAL